MSKKAEILRVMILTIAIGVGFAIQIASEHGWDALQISAVPQVQVEALPTL